MQGEYDTIESRSLNLFNRAGNFEGPGHENEHVAPVDFRLGQGVNGKLPGRFIHDFALQVLDLNRKRSASPCEAPPTVHLLPHYPIIIPDLHDTILSSR